MTVVPDAVATVETFAVEVPFAHRFQLGSGLAGAPGQAGDVLFVKITTESGAVGWGEQRALPSWSYETIETLAVVVQRHLAPLVVGRSVFAIEAFHAAATRTLSPAVSNGFPFARSAVDLALHDAAGVIAGLPVHALLGGRIRDEIPLCSAIGIDTPAATTERVLESSDYHAYKIKIGGDVDADAAAIHAAAEAAGTKLLWLDANQAYRPTALRQLLRRVADVDTLACLEQPVPGTDWAAMGRLRGSLGLPLAVDEGSFSAADLARTDALHGADLVVIKIGKAGGLRQALKTAAVAHAHGIEILASGLTDCGIGFAAALHVFSQLELALPAELNGPELLTDLYVEGLSITRAVATVPTRPGLGITVDEDRIRTEARAVFGGLR